MYVFAHHLATGMIWYRFNFYVAYSWFESRLFLPLRYSVSLLLSHIWIQKRSHAFLKSINVKSNTNFFQKASSRILASVTDSISYDDNRFAIDVYKQRHINTCIYICACLCICVYLCVYVCVSDMLPWTMGILFSTKDTAIILFLEEFNLNRFYYFL